jgi:hypothetical protein
MLVRLTKATRRCAAMLIGALYALCIIMPTAAVALGAGDRPVHCFTDEQLGLTHVHQPGVGHAHAEGKDLSFAHVLVGEPASTSPEHALATTHVQADDTTHHHDGTHQPAKSGNGGDPAACCGLFGLTAMAVDPQLDLGAPSRVSSIIPLSLEKLTGRGPDRINRPPIVPLPL